MGMGRGLGMRKLYPGDLDCWTWRYVFVANDSGYAV